MEMLTHAINWVEISVTDFKRAKRFFSHIFDFDMPDTIMDGVSMGFLLYDMQSRRVGGAIVQFASFTDTEGNQLRYTQWPETV